MIVNDARKIYKLGTFCLSCTPTRLDSISGPEVLAPKVV